MLLLFSKKNDILDKIDTFKDVFMAEDAQKKNEKEGEAFSQRTENQADKEWKNELTQEAKGKVIGRNAVKDIHKESNRGFFQTLRQHIRGSKKLQQKIKAAMDKLKQQIQDSKRKIKEALEAFKNARPYKAVIVCVGYAKKLTNFLKESKEMAAGDLNQMQGIEKSGMRSSYKTLVGVRYKEPKKLDIEVKVKDKGKNKEEEKGAEKGKEAEKPENKNQNAQGADKKPEVQNVSEAAAESAAKPANAKQKEVARGVSSAQSAKEERQEGIQVNAAEKEGKARLGLSKQAEKELMKEERRQEKEFKRLEKENDKGITAERTENGKEKQQEEKSSEKVKQAGAEKKTADAIRHAELVHKIDNLREKLDDLHKRRSEQNADKGNAAPVNRVKMTAEEVKELPSMKAEMSLEKAEASMELPKAERGGAVTEASLNKMERTAEQAEAGVKKATLVPDYATDEFKQKAAEQNIPLNKTGKETANEQQTDRQKMLALSGRSVEQPQNQSRDDGQQNQNEAQNQTEQQSEKPQYSIDPEKSRKMSAENNGKQIDMQKYQMMKQMRGGRAAG